ncbi:MAG: hypothetical protein MAG715_00088 [Methanonatronarchaeales archaeon]|nr:hypothetical protein [Methanonatronarchaeales archaeon]
MELIGPMVVVSNATPLIYLSKAGKLHLLREVFGRVIVPEEVRVEVVDRGKSLGMADALVVEEAVEEGWLVVRETPAPDKETGLDPGESAVLSLADVLDAEVVVIDEVSARVAARILGLEPRGTVYVLLRALESGELDLDGFLEALNDMVQHGFRLKEEIYVEAVREARRISEQSR